MHARTQHPNASLTPKARLRMVKVLLEEHWTVESTAERFQIDAKTVRKWRDRYQQEGHLGLYDRTSKPRSSCCDARDAVEPPTSPTRPGWPPPRSSGSSWRTAWAASTERTGRPSRWSASATGRANSSTWT